MKQAIAIQYDRPKRGADLRISVLQLPCNGWDMSYNPDDEKWYVEHPETGKAYPFTERRNALRYARTHSI